MLFDEVHFRKFSVSPTEIMESLPVYKPVAWGPEWEVVSTQGDPMSIYAWAKDHLEGKIDLCSCHDGSMLVAFTNSTDAILFKISYESGVLFS